MARWAMVLVLASLSLAVTPGERARADSGTINDARDATAAASLGLSTNALENSSATWWTAASQVLDVGVTGVSIGSPVVGDTFERGETIEVTLTFNRAVDVRGTPQLALVIGTETRQASYTSGTGTASLVFRYTVAQTDADSDGISIGADALSLNGGTIDVAGGTRDAVLGLGQTAISDSGSHKVAGGTLTASAVSGVAIASTPLDGVSGTYVLGDTIEVTVTFNRAVNVSGTPQLALGIGTATQQAAYASGTDTDSLTFRYAVQFADRASIGIRVGASALGLNSGMINDARDAMVAASLDLSTNVILPTATHKVDGSRGSPRVTGVAIGSPVVGDTFERGDAIEVTVTFNKAVDVSGTPQLALEIGSQTRQASYASGTGTASLVFRYVVVAVDADSDGLSIGANALSLNSGTIDVASGTRDAVLGLGANAIENSGSHKVAGGTLTVALSGVAITSRPTSGSTYGLSEQIEVAVTFNRAVNVSGTPQLALGIGTETRQADYATGTGTDSLTFRYRVQAAGSDADGISVGADALGLNGGTINDARDGTRAVSLGLGANAITNSSDHRVDGSQGPPGVTAGMSVLGSRVGDTYERGETIEVTVPFNKAVDVGGTPQLALGIGTATRQANYVSGTGTTSLVFAYTVVQADADNDGISIAADALTLNGGRIDVAGGTTDALLGLGANAFENNFSLKVAGGTLTASAANSVAVTSSPAGGSTYGPSERIEVTVGFNLPVTVSGTPQLALRIGTETRQANYVSGTGTYSLTFRYAVAAADSDTDGISVGATALGLNSGTIKDARDATVAASLGLGANAITNDGDHMVDGNAGPPAVQWPGMSFLTTPAVPETYTRGERFEILIIFNKAVDVGGTPQLALGIGTETRQANYVSGTGTTSLIFAYTVVQADADNDGISVAADALTLNGGRIDVAGGTTDALLGLGRNAVESTGLKVAGGTFTVPAANGVAVTSSPASGSTYEADEQIEVTVTFNLPVMVSGTPQLALGIGTATRQANYVSGTGTRHLTFRYTVRAADRDRDGISVAAAALGLNSGTIKDARDATVAASLGLGANAITNDGNHRVDGREGPPGVTGVAIGLPVAGDTFERGEAIEVTVTFSKAVDVSGTPQLALGIGAATRQATYASGTGKALLVFRYVVVQADADSDGLSIGADALTGRFRASDGTGTVVLGLGANAIENSGSHKVAGGTWTTAVNGVAITSSPASGSTYGPSERIEVAVTFNRPVTVTGTTQLALGIGAATRQASYLSGTGTASLTFRYVVQAADSDADGLSVGASALTVNGTNMGLGTNAITNDGSHGVNGAREPPRVTRTSIPLPYGEFFQRADSIWVRVDFNTAVDVGGTPQLALGIGTATRQANYVSGTGTASLTFRYVVQAADSDADGLSIAADALTLNGGTIDVAGGTLDAVLGLGANAISDRRSHKVKGGTYNRPFVTRVFFTSVPSDGSTYVSGEEIVVRVTFSRPVTVLRDHRLSVRIRLGLSGSLSARRSAWYFSSSGTGLEFRYTVQAADDSGTDGINFPLGYGDNPLSGVYIGFHGERIPVVRYSNSVFEGSDTRVDGSRGLPSVTGVQIGSPVVGDTFERGDTIEATVRFNEAVDVRGTPQLALEIGTATRQADYASGTGTRALVFQYTVAAADTDNDGLSIGWDALALNGGTIDVAGGTTDAVLSLWAGVNLRRNIPSRKVAGSTLTAAAVSGAAIASTPASGSTYGPSEQIEVGVTFTRPVTVSGTPQLALGIGTETRQANYVSGTGTDSLTFRYAVVVADSDADGLSVGASALTLNSGTIKDARYAAVASLGLGTNAITDDGDHRVDGSQGSPGVTGVTLNSPTVGDTYERGETIEVTVTFNKTVEVSGTPQLALGIGTQTRQASYASGTGMASLVFRYTVVSGDADNDGLSIAADALGLNSGTIDVAGGTIDALLGLGANAIENSGSHKVAGGTFTAAAVNGAAIVSTPASGSEYGPGEQIEVGVTFTRPVTVSGAPQLALGIGTATRQASYATGTGTDSLTFQYTVQPSDRDTDGISVGASALGLNSGTINDARDAMAAALGLGTHAITNDGNHKVSFLGPAIVTGVAIGSPAVGDTFELGETIEVTVTFDRWVEVANGTPQLALGIGTQTRQADYASGTGTVSLVFRYAVVAADTDGDGLSIGADALSLNGAYISDVRRAHAALGLGANAIENSGSHKVDGSRGPPVVTGVAIGSPAVGDTFVGRELIEVTVTFNQAVDVTGQPALALGIGTGRNAYYASGTGTTSLVFSYRVSGHYRGGVFRGDRDTNGISIGADALTYFFSSVSQAIVAAGGTVDARLDLGANAITNSSGHKVDGSLWPDPRVSDVAITSSPSSGGTYGQGERIEVAVTLVQPAVLHAGSAMELVFGVDLLTGVARRAEWSHSDYSHRIHTFHYEVRADDSDTNGISVTDLLLIRDWRHTQRQGVVPLGTHQIVNDWDHKVDGSQGLPKVTGVALNSPTAGDTYEWGDTIEVTVTFNKAVDVSGTPQLALGIGAVTQADYLSGTGTTSLVFRYMVGRTDADADGISIATDALSGVIRVSDGTAAASLGLGTNAITNSSGHKVDGSLGSPGVTGVAIGSPVVGDTFERGETIEVTVTFNQAVDVGGAPQLGLGIGTQTRQASYASGTGTASLVFRYTVMRADADTDGLSIGANALGLNGGRIEVAGVALDDALLGLGTNAVENSGSHKVAGGTFTAAAVSGAAIASSPASSSTYRLGEWIEVGVTFTRPVTVSGTPQLALGIGTATRQADYASGTGTDSLTFRYAVVAADSDNDGLSVGGTALGLNSGTINDVSDGTTAASLGLGTNAITNSSSHRVDGSQGPPGVTGVAIGSPVVGDTFERGETIEVTVTFNKAVDVSGTPQLALGIGSATRQASYASGTGTASLVFRYTVASGDADTDGLGIAANALSLNSGTIDVASGTTDAVLSLRAHSRRNIPSRKVAGGTFTASAVSGVVIASTPAASSTYSSSERIEVAVTFTRPVTVSGAPQLALGIGSETRQAAYASGTGTDSLTFRYTVQVSDRDTDGLSVGATALGLNSGAINDARDAAVAASLGLGTNAITNDGDHRVDGAQEPLGVTGVTVGLPEVGSTFERGERIEVTVTFNRAVDVDGTPQLALGIGAQTRQASYASGTGTASLVFRYTVVSADTDNDGLSIAANALSLNSGTIEVAGGTTDALLGLGTNAIENSGSHKVAGGTFTGAVASGVAITSSPGSGNTYGQGERIEVAVTFTRSVTVSGMPQLALGIDSATRQVAYASGTGTDSLTFRYTVQASDRDSDGISVGATALSLNSGAINDARDAMVAASLSTNAITNSTNHRVDGSVATATVNSVSISSAPASGDTYKAGETISVQVGFSASVTVTGTPQLALGIGSATRQAAYASGSGTGTLTFSYEVAATDEDNNGISVVSSALSLNNGTIKTATSANAALGLGSHAITDASSHKVDGPATAPVVNAVSIVTSPASGNTYGAGETISVQVDFTLPVTVTGTPTLALGIGTKTPTARYSSGSGTRSLVFTYVTKSTDADTDGISVPATGLALSGGTMQSAAGVDAARGLGSHAISNAPAHKVDGRATVPAVSAVSITSSPQASSTYKANEIIYVDVQFTIPVRVTSTPQLALTIGSETRLAEYASGTGTASLTFRYTVVADDEDTDGIEIGASALSVRSGGTIRSEAGTPAALGLGSHAISAASGHKVNGGNRIDARLVKLAFTSLPGVGNTYGLGETITATAEFNLPVRVTGTPAILIDVGTNRRRALYTGSSGTEVHGLHVMARRLTFSYTVTADDEDTNGIGVEEGAVWRTSINRIVDSGGADAVLDENVYKIPDASSHRVDGKTDNRASFPSVRGVDFNSAPTVSTYGYNAGETISARIFFTKDVTVTGTPQLALTIGRATRQAAYASGSGTTILTFRYTVQISDYDRDGISIGVNALSLNSGTIRIGSVNAVLGLGIHAISNRDSQKVNRTRERAYVNTVSIVTSPASGDTYGAGETITVRVGFHIPVLVTGTPQLRLGVGSLIRQAAYAGGSGTDELTFGYVVAATDTDNNGISVRSDALTYTDPEMIKDELALAADLGLGIYAVSNEDGHKVNGAATVPAVNAVAVTSSPASGDTYGAGETITVTVGFQIPVTVIGTPQLALGMGAGTVQAAYASGSGTKSLTFEYAVSTTDTDTDGISIGGSALGLNGGTVQSGAGTAAVLALGTNAITDDGDHKVDGSLGPPRVTGVAIGAPAVGDTFERGDTIEATVTFNKAVDVSGTPQLALGIGMATRQASYASGTGTASLVFRYTVVQADADTDGLSIAAEALTLNSGTIDVAGGTTNAVLGLGANAIENSGSHKVAGGTLTAAAVSSAAIASTPASGSTYGLGEQIEVRVTFNRAVTVTGTPQLALGVGTETRQAAYASSPSTATVLVFRYTVQAADRDADGISVGASALGLNSGTINDARAGATVASLGLGTNAIANDGDHRVDGSQGPPGVTGVAIGAPTVGDTFERGEAIEVTVTFNKAVDVSGAPQLALVIGTATRQASYASGTGTASLVFRYTVVSGDADNDGLSVGANALGLNSGTIDVAGGTLDALLGLGANAIENSGSHKVAGGTFTAAAVSGASITSSPSSGSTYGPSEQIEVAVTFTRPVTVSGAPQLALVIGTETRQASYASGSSTATVLAFQYAVVATDSDANGLSVGANALGLNSGTINDARSGGGAASLGLGTNAIANDGDHRVDGSLGPPGVTGVAIGAPVVDDTFERGEAIEVTVTFNKAVDVGGTPQLALGIGSETQQASYASGTGTASLVFRYTVASGDADPDGISIGADALGLNSGEIDVAGGTLDALLRLGTNAVENSESHKVAGGTFTAAAVSGVSIASSPASGSTYGPSEQIEVAVTFTRPVTVSGAPQLALVIGTETRQASYASSPSTATVLVFRYTVASDDADPDGISVGATALTLNSGMINDARAGATAASLGLGTNAIANDGDHKVDGSQGPPGVTGVAIGAPAVGDTFERGDTIEVTVTFNKAVDVSGTPQLVLGIGAATQQASYVSGTGTASLVFWYTVASGDVDNDGLSIGADALGLNSGTIDVAGGTLDALLGLGANAVENSSSHKVAGGTLTASAVSGAAIASTPSSGSTYGLGETIEVAVTFTRPVTVNGAPQLALVIGTETRQASYASGSGTDSLTFRYAVQASDRDTDGISVVATALTLNSGSINDARDAATAASLGLGTNAITNDGDHKVDGAQGPPGVTGVALNSPVVGDIYEQGETIEVTVTFNKAVDVGGTPQLALGIGSATRQASYVSGTGTASLVFRYTVASGDVDNDGLSIAADALGLNSGTIDVAGGTLDALLGLGANAIENSTGHKVAGGTLTAAAASGAAIASTPSSGSTYGLGETIEVAVTFNRAVTVNGAPQLALGIGTETRQASYASGSGTDSLTFRYAVQASDRDTDGISVGASALTLNSGSINDARDAAVAATLGLGANAITNDGDHRVDGSQGPPGVTGVALNSPVVGDIYERGEAIEVTVTFNKAVDVGGTPQLALGIGAATQQASYVSGTGTASLVFRYTVASGDVDNDGLSIAANALGLNSGTIDVAGGTLDALLGLGANAVENSGSHKVAGGTFTASAVSGAAVASSPASGSTYGLGETIEVAVTFTRPVTVSGAPQLALGVGTETRQASYASGSGTDSLTFRYAVQASDNDTDGLSVGATALGLNSGTINDARSGGGAASLGLGVNAIANDGDHKVDGSQGPPGVTGVAIGSPVVGDTFERGDTIEVTVTFNKAVDVGGAPQLALGIGSATRQASYASGTGTASLVFRYTVVQTDADTDGLSIGADALGLNSGTIDVAGGTTDALLGLGANAIENSGSHKVAGGTFTAAAVSGASIASSPASGSTYGLGEQIEVRVTFNRAVTVGGAPQLALGIGTETRQASYASGSSTATVLAFQYAVMATDSDANGLSVGANALGLNSGTINDARSGGGAASLGLGVNAIANDGDHKVDGSQGPPGVTGVAIGSPVVGDTFERGDTIEVTVTFNKAVDVGGTPQLALGIGTATRQASYASGTGTASLVFRYTVASGDVDNDGLSIAADALGLNSGTIDVAGGTLDALLGLGANAIENSGSHKVAGGTLTAAAASGAAIASTPSSGSTYGLGETIEVAVTFTRAVTVNGAPQLALGIGAETRQASYASGSGTDSLTFRYAVQASDRDTDGISVGASALTLNSGSINDARDAAVAATLGLGANAIANDGDHKVDGAQGPPGVTGVALNSPVVGDTFERGEAIEATVTFNKAVDVGGTPQLGLGIGTATRQASYASGTGTASLVFRYTVVQTDADTDGLSIAADALGLNSGTIDVAGGTTDALLGLGANAIENSGSHKVAGGTLTAAAVSGAAITSSPASGSTYGLSEQIEVRVTFNRAVTVSGAPQLALVIGTETRQASYASSSSTATVLAFRYAVMAADSDANGLSVAADALGLNSGTIDDARSGGGAASLGLGVNAIVNDGDHKVDGSQGPPGVTGVAIGSPVVGDTFERGDTIEVTVTFNKAVDVGGTPQLALGIGSATRQASYVSGTGTASLVFRYTVASGDVDNDGLSIAADALGLNSGTIDVAGGTLDALLGLGANAIENSTGHKVAGGTLTAAAASGAAIASTPSSGSTYGLGETIEVAVTFNRAVTVNGAPQLALGIGTETRQASYASGSGTDSLTFRYAVQASDRDTDGISVGASALTLNSGSINDARDAAVAATLGLGANAITNDGDHRVDGSQGPPGVTGVALNSPVVGDIYERGEAIEVTVTFNKAVDVGGTPQLALGIGAATQQASYVSGTGTASLVFRYTVASGDADNDGLSIAANALSLNSGSIDVAGGALDALLGLGANAIENSGSHKVAGGTLTASAASGAAVASSPASGSTYGLSETIEVAVTFTRAVTVNGAPQLALGIGTETRQASYASGSGTDSLTFRYTVVTADRDTDGLSVGASALTLNSGSINDARDAAAAASLGLGTNAITDDGDHKVDGSQGPPGVTGVALNSPVVGDIYERGETIEVTVTFNKAVDVGGTPQLALGIGAATQQASYVSGTGTASLVFRYTVASGDVDNDGLSIGANALTLNSGSIDVAGGTLDALLGLGANAIENSGSHKVAGGTLTASAASGAAVASSPASGSTYGLGETIEVAVTFTRPVTVSGAPQLALVIGTEMRQASYASGSGTDSLTFRYAVQASDRDTDGLSVGATALTLNSGTINDARSGGGCGEPRTGHERDRQRRGPQGGRQPGAAGGDGGGDRRAGGGRHVRAGRYDRGDGDVQQGGGRGRHAAAGVGDRHGDAAGVLRLRDGHGVAGVPLQGGADGCGYGRAQHRGGRAGAEQRDDRRGGRDDRCAAGTGCERDREQHWTQGGGRDVDGGGGERRVDREQPGERQHVRTGRADRGTGDVQPGGDGGRRAAAGAGDRHGDAAGELRLGLEHGDGPGVPVRRDGDGQRRERAQRRGGCADAEQWNDQRRARRDDGGEPRTGDERDRQRRGPQSGRRAGAAGGDGGGDRRAGGGRHVRAWRGDRGDGDVQQGGGRGRHAAAGAGDRHGDAAGVLRLRDGHGVAGVPLHGGADGCGYGRAQHRGGRAGAEQRDDRRGGRDVGRAAGTGRERDREQREPQGGGRDVDGGGGERRVDREQPSERQHVRSERADRGAGDVQPGGDGERRAAAGAGGRHGDAAGELRLELEHGDGPGVPLRRDGGGQRRERAQRRGGRAGTEQRNDRRRAQWGGCGEPWTGHERDRQRRGP